MNEYQYIVIGLGNKGDEYKKTRHNAGYMVLDHVLCNENFTYDKYTQCYTAKQTIHGIEIIYVKPDTYMNESGIIIPLLTKKYGPFIPVIIHDELDTNIGEIKLSTVRGAGGHNGVKSILEYLPEQSQNLRIRIGIAQIHDDRIVKPNVLDNFLSSELTSIEQLTPTIQTIIELIAERGIDYAVSAYTNKTP
jgi:PTH1 family peptidyl-tRNA hydrolase